MAQKVLNFIVVEESNLLTDDVGKLDEGGVEGFEVALREVFEEAAEGNEMIGLGNGFKIFPEAVFFAIELEAELTQEFLGNVDREEVTEVDVGTIHDAKGRGLLEDAERNVLETDEVAFVILGGFFRAATFDFKAFDEIDDEFGKRRLVDFLGRGLGR